MTKLSPHTWHILNRFIIGVSVFLCVALSLTRLPGMELLGITPNWLLIWLVAWSVKRSIFQSAIAGLALGLIQDGMTGGSPSHIFSFIVVGVLTAQIQKQKYVQEDFISVALIVFVMAILAESIITIQYGMEKILPLENIWLDYQRIALASAILSSLWTPVIYYPLNRWWESLKD